MDEIVLYYPPELNGPREQPVGRDRFEQIVRDVMPQLRL
jgi:hypothetical protein